MYKGYFSALINIKVIKHLVYLLLIFSFLFSLSACFKTNNTPPISSDITSTLTPTHIDQPPITSTRTMTPTFTPTPISFPYPPDIPTRTPTSSTTATGPQPSKTPTFTSTFTFTPTQTPITLMPVCTAPPCFTCRCDDGSFADYYLDEQSCVRCPEGCFIWCHTITPTITLTPSNTPIITLTPSITPTFTPSPIVMPPPSGYPLTENFDSSEGFTSTDPDVYISDGLVHWEVWRSGEQQYVYRSIPPFSGDVRLTVRGTVNGATNNCSVAAGIGDGIHVAGEPFYAIAVTFGFFGGGCPIQSYLINAWGVRLDHEYFCTYTTGTWLWGSKDVTYTAELIVQNGLVNLSVPELGSVSGREPYPGEYNTLFVGLTGGGDWPHCWGTIDQIKIEPLP